MPDIDFDDNPDGFYRYRSVHYHQKNAKRNENKTRWCIDSEEEFRLFKRAENHGCEPLSLNDNGDDIMWENMNHTGLVTFDEGLPVIGDGGERFAFIKAPDRTEGKDDYWHGYPVRPVVDYAGRELIDWFRVNDYISGPNHKRIIKRMI